MHKKTLPIATNQFIFASWHGTLIGLQLKI